MCVCVCRYQLQLLGSHRVPSVCHAMALLRPGSADTCQLVVACHSGVQVYSLRASIRAKADAGAYDISLQHLYQVETCHPQRFDFVDDSQLGAAWLCPYSLQLTCAIKFTAIPCCT